jgi:hypothetical protein
MARIVDLLGKELGGKRHDNNGELLDTLFENVESRALATINWYMNARRGRARLSKLLRASTLFFVACGTLIPLLDAIALRTKRAFELGSWGYVFFALAGGLVLADKYFGVSSAWMRFLSTGLALERSLRRFQLDWVSRIAQLNGVEPTADETRQLLAVLREFSESVEAEILQETSAWIAEFRSGLSELEQMAKKGPEQASRQNAETRRSSTTDENGATAPAAAGPAVVRGPSPIAEVHGNESGRRRSAYPASSGAPR